MKHIAEKLFRQTLAAISISAAVKRKLGRSGAFLNIGAATYDLQDFREILVVAFGKAAFAMAEAVGEVFSPEYPYAGIMVVPSPPQRELPHFRTFVGGHPIPTAASFEAGDAILRRLSKCDEGSLILFLISGGGSSLVEWPLNSTMSLDDFRILNAQLTQSGAPIEEINAVRKHVSAIKAGRMAAAAPGSMKISLAISDVPRGQESAIASGPTLPDPTTIRDAERVIRQYGLLEKIPVSMRAALEAGKLKETPKEDDISFARSSFTVLLSEHDLTHSAHRTCEADGFASLCDNSTDNWPIERASEHLLGQLQDQKQANPKRPVAIVAGGEVASPVTGNGIGGRNSAFVLACVPKIAGKNITVLSAGTDGIDGNSLAAGAVADGESLARASSAGLNVQDCQRRCDAYSFFAAIGDAIVTGPTGNNLRDLRILLME